MEGKSLEGRKRLGGSEKGWRVGKGWRVEKEIGAQCATWIGDHGASLAKAGLVAFDAESRAKWDWLYSNVLRQ